MKTIMSVSTLCTALLLMVSAVPGEAATISFTSSLGGGDITTNPVTGASATIVGLLENFDTLTVIGGTHAGSYHPLFLSESLSIGASTETLTMSGTLTGCASCSAVFPDLTSSSVLATIVFNSTSALTGNATASNVSVNMPSLASISSITLSSALLADLGLGGSTFTLTNLGNVSSASQPGNYQNQSSGVLTFDSASVPEPSFLPLTALVLGLGVLVLRKRSSSAA